MKNLIKNHILYKKSYLILNNFLYLKNIIKKSEFYIVGYAVALVQLGIRLNIFSVYYKKYFFFLNFNKIWRSSEKYFFEEGCLSFEENIFKKRSKYIMVKCENLKKNKKKIFLKNFTSICFQHEIDHLIGNVGLIAQ
ncbi:peptide deformylase [Candidatus Vidania fulgoroideorum]